MDCDSMGEKGSEVQSRHIGSRPSLDIKDKEAKM